MVRYASVSSQMDKTSCEELTALATRRSEFYRLAGYHCSESVIRACNDALNLRLSDDMIRCVCGFRGGGGGSGGRCGVAEVGIVLISLLYGRDNAYVSADFYSALILRFLSQFAERFQALDCKAINSKEIENCGSCKRLYVEGAALVCRFLIEAGLPTAAMFRDVSC